MTDRDMMLVWEAWAKQDGNDGAAALFRRVYEQLADSDRLDWWESQRTYTLAPVMDAQGWRLHLPDVLRPLTVPFNHTLRAAIDELRIRPPAEYVQDFGGTVECIAPPSPNGVSHASRPREDRTFVCERCGHTRHFYRPTSEVHEVAWPISRITDKPLTQEDVDALYAYIVELSAAPPAPVPTPDGAA